MEKFELYKNIFINLYNCECIERKNLQTVLRDAAEKYKIAEITSMLYDNYELLYVGGVCGEDHAEYSMTTTDKKRLYVRCTSIEGVKWSDEEKDELAYLCLIIYTIAMKKKLAKISDKFYFYDTITGLPNLNYLLKHGEMLVISGEICKYTAFFANIKGFNFINKAVGYNSGTKILRKYMSSINDELGEGEFVARLGGDNFVVLAKDENVPAVIDKLNSFELEWKTEKESLVFNMSARAGVLDVTSVPDNFGIIMNSISATYSYGRNISNTNITYCTEDIVNRVIRMKSYSRIFESALKDGDIFVMYQPKVLITDNSVYGGEALVRWKNNGKIIPPSDFIPALEMDHSICELDFFVLEETCKMLRSCIDRGIEPVRISVNYSNEHLNDENLIERTTAIVDKYNIPHEYIEIEMTETVDNEENVRLPEYVNGLRASGFTVAIDDFGVGYSSMHLLNSVPVDVLKIDKSFVAEINSKPDNRERIILKNIINMASELGIEVVAEGVETKIQIEMLRNMSCYRIQGFIFDKPLMGEAFAERIFNKTYEDRN